MADRQAKLRNLLYDEARKRRYETIWNPRTRRKQKLWLGSNPGRPNAAAIATATGVAQTTVWRVLLLKRNIRPAQGRKRPVPDYRPEAALEEGLMAWLRCSAAGLADRMEHAPPAPPVPKGKSTRRRR